MKAINRFLYSWLPGGIWMFVIFLVSSQPRVSVIDNHSINFILLKTLHILAYAFLYFLLFRGFYLLAPSLYSLKKKFMYTFIFTVLYAVSDELHQTFVPFREGKLRDVFIDMIGMLIMYSYIKHNLKVVKRLI